MSKLLSLFLILFLFLFAPIQAVYAQGPFRSGENVVVDRDEVVNHDLFLTGDQIIVSGTVNGDLYAAGGSIVIEGQINGDVLAAGGSLAIRGQVSDDVRIAGGEIDVSGSINRNLTAMGGSIDIANNATVSGSLVAGGGEISQFGNVGRGAVIGGGQVTIGNQIGGDTFIGGEVLTLTSNAVINGNLDYWSNKRLQQNSGARIEGNTTLHENETTPQERSLAQEFAGFGLLWTVYSFIVSLILGMLFIRLVPVFTKNFSEIAVKRPGISFLIGLLVTILTPIMFILLLITVLGIPLALILLALFLVLLYLAKVFTAIFVGRKALQLLKIDSGLYRSLAFGLLILLILDFIPVVGWIAGFVLFMIGVGAILLTKREVYLSLRNSKKI